MKPAPAEIVQPAAPESKDTLDAIHPNGGAHATPAASTTVAPSRGPEEGEAPVAPTKDARNVVRHLLDFPIDGVYWQALRLDPVRDSLEKLARFVQFAHAIRSHGLPVIVGRVGAFGLVLQALGITAFDSPKPGRERATSVSAEPQLRRDLPHAVLARVQDRVFEAGERVHAAGE